MTSKHNRFRKRIASELNHNHIIEMSKGVDPYDSSEQMAYYLGPGDLDPFESVKKPYVFQPKNK